MEKLSTIFGRSKYWIIPIGAGSVAYAAAWLIYKADKQSVPKHLRNAIIFSMIALFIVQLVNKALKFRRRDKRYGAFRNLG